MVAVTGPLIDRNARNGDFAVENRNRLSQGPQPNERRDLRNTATANNVQALRDVRSWFLDATANATTQHYEP